MSCATCAMRATAGVSSVPASIDRSPRIAANSDDLPLPLAPTRPMRSPGGAISETFAYSVRAPRARATSISLSIGESWSAARAARVRVLRQFFLARHEHHVVAGARREPGHRDVAEHAFHVGLAVAHLHEQQAAALQVAARLTD